MAKNHYLKELIGNPYIVGGEAVSFEPLGNSRGHISVDVGSDLDKALAKAASEHRGGIVKITEQELSEKKTLEPYIPSSRSSRTDMLRPMRPQTPFNARPGVVEPAKPDAAATVQPQANAKVAFSDAPAPALPPDPPAVPKFRPATRRVPPMGRRAAATTTETPPVPPAKP